MIAANPNGVGKLRAYACDSGRSDLEGSGEIVARALGRCVRMMTVVWSGGITMLAIDEISIQVPLDIAEAYRQSSLEDRQKMSLRIGAMLRQDLAQPIGTYAKLRQTMNKLATEAEQNGLTPEILESILNDE
ncbi:MAG: hypothetical protein NT070_09020 [Cyanobacteria bacterium]|nr:hypothetical protein [Cyanobacteriota bacterium]